MPVTPTAATPAGGADAVERGVFFPTSDDVPPGFCHAPGVLDGGDLLFEAADICVIKYRSSQATMVMIQADDIERYRFLKKEADCAIATIRRQRPGTFYIASGGFERLFWAPSENFGTSITRADLTTGECEPAFDPAAGEEQIARGRTRSARAISRIRSRASESARRRPWRAPRKSIMLEA